HDINNNLANISQLLKDNHINESLEYIHAITETLDTTKSVINSGNNYLDAIINYEIAICKKNQINFQLKIDSIPQLNISPTDLSSVISNLLNNAIEANLNLEKCARYISLKIFCYKNYLSIIVENPYKNKLIKDGLILKTTKIDNGYHGYGLKLIRSSVEKYNGVFKYNYKNNIFTSVIMLPLNTNN
ncbi:MAG: ATP-binding protein, partial [Clostridium butyricum]|nr:ATP-binding protein [Clostridium butyricum]